MIIEKLKKVKNTIVAHKTAMNKFKADYRHEVTTMKWMGEQMRHDIRGTEPVKYWNNVPVLLLNHYCLKSGAPSTAPMAICCETLSGKEVFIVNNAFLELTEETQQAIFAHEHGHYVNRDIDRIKNMFLPELQEFLYDYGLGQRMIFEYQADLYAHRQGHDIIRALEETEEVFGGWVNLEVSLRKTFIKAVKVKEKYIK